ncbi:MAG: hypothetical protein JWM80_5420 [Cyanobacteria bacterium RYN_339]|nr:hypothetical protein [Cyanobacteria bacterium RYN_339]
MQAMAVVGLYVACTAPFLVLILYVHALRSSYTNLLIIALILQLIPIGLVFFPLGFIGVALLAYTLAVTGRRNRLFRLGGYDNPAVDRRWTREYVANLWAFGLALEQKGVALVFVQVTSRQGLSGLWQGLLPASVLVWALLGHLIWRERRRMKSI